MFDDALARVGSGVSGPFAGVPFLLKDLVAESSGGSAALDSG
jgi:Asp-tRNA(Asn)/Glu-tRNA(Gln) amidotransferase A subunit family amidase